MSHIILVQVIGFLLQITSISAHAQKAVYEGINASNNTILVDTTNIRVQIGGNLRINGPSPWTDVTNQAFGAKGDGSTDDTAAIQSAASYAAATTPNGTLYFPAGNYVVKSTITFNPVGGKAINIRGQGMYATKIDWQGPAGSVVFS